MTLVTFKDFVITDIRDEQDTAYEFHGTFADNSTTITSVTIDMYYNGEDYKLVIEPKEAKAYSSIPDTGEHLSSEIYKDLFHHALDCQGNLLFKDFVTTYIDKYSRTFNVRLIRQKTGKVFKGSNLYYHTGTHVEQDFDDAIVIDIDTLKRSTVIHYAQVKDLSKRVSRFTLDDEIEFSNESENEVVTKTLIRYLISNSTQEKTIVYSSSQAEWFEDFMHYWPEFIEVDNLKEISLAEFVK